MAILKKQVHGRRFCKQCLILHYFTYHSTPMTVLGPSLYRNGKFLALIALCAKALFETTYHISSNNVIRYLKVAKITRLIQNYIPDFCLLSMKGKCDPLGKSGFLDYKHMLICTHNFTVLTVPRTQLGSCEQEDKSEIFRKQFQPAKSKGNFLSICTE